jgi:hypothetical protein
LEDAKVVCAWAFSLLVEGGTEIGVPRTARNRPGEAVMREVRARECAGWRDLG